MGKWDGIPVFVTPESSCPACGHEFNRASNATGEDEPKAGDITLCFGCGEVLVFDEGLGVRMPTMEELREFRKDERVMGAVAKARQQMRSVGGTQ